MPDYVILSIDNCAFCDKAKTALNERSISYAEINCADEPEVAMLLGKVGRTTFPLVFRVVGGFTELDAQLQQAG